MHLVLHLHWRPPADAGGEPTFLLWAETRQGSPLARGRGRPPERPRPRPHPFAVADGAELRRYLQAFDPTAISSGVESFVLLMPSTRTGPLPSPELVHSWELDRSTPELMPWIITGLRLPPDTAVRLLGRLGVQTCPDHLALGTDLRFWHTVFNLVLAILARQHYIPSLVACESGAGLSYRAVWQPVLEGSTFERDMTALACAMPPVCRAEADGADTGQEPHPLELVRSFIAVCCDHLVRAWGLEAPHRIGYLHSRLPASLWLKTLLSSDPTIREVDSAFARFAEDLRAWQRNLAPIGDAAYVIALRLLPPPLQPSPDGKGEGFYVPEGGWRLEYLLQARDDPDILVPAVEVWLGPGESLIYRQRRFDRPQEQLLAGLGRAAQIYPPIARSLKAPAPTGVELSTREVYTFLREAAPLLEQSGFSLLLPGWWEEAGARLGLSYYLTPLMPHPPDIVRDPAGAERPIAYRWELVLGHTPLTRSAFAELVALRSPLVQKDGRWLRLDPEQIEAAEHFWERQSFEGRIDLRQALRAALSLDEHSLIAGLPVVQKTIEGWLPALIKRLTEGDESLRQAVQPPTLNGTLRPYQRFGYAWLHEHRHLGLGACLADDMGLGKSIQAIALLLREKAEAERPTGGNGSMPPAPKPTLLICPTSLLGNWRRELERFAPSLRVFVHYGADRPREDTFAATVARYDVIVTSYTLARRDHHLFTSVAWGGLILDEAQKIKNPEIQVTQAVNRIPADFRLALTGTPIENQLEELWSIFNFLNRGYLGSQMTFRKQFAYPIERYHDPVTTARLQRMVRPFILRRLKSDPNVIQDLPERLEMKVYCTLTDEQAELYRAIVEEALPRVRDLHGRARRIHIFNLLTRLKQVLNHPVQYLAKTPIDANHIPDEPLARRSGKLDRLVEMLEEVLAVGDRALIYTQFAETGYLLVAHLQQQFDIPVLYLHGGVPARQRQQMIAEFQENPHAPPLFVLTLKTGGLGLNLTAANHVFHYDRWWNPAVEDQASDRAYRIGQLRNVQIHKFITAGTVEEAIDALIERKQGLLDAIVGADESWLADLSDEELAELVSLSQERV